MGTRKVKDAKDLGSGKKIYFNASAKSTYMSNGKSVEEMINDTLKGDSELLVVRVSGINEGFTIYVMDENDNVIWSQTSLYK